MHLFHCPDCHRLHADPLDAAFVLAIRCVDCHMARARAEAATPAPELTTLQAA